MKEKSNEIAESESDIDDATETSVLHQYFWWIIIVVVVVVVFISARTLGAF